ncbi:MAG: hypothetical protein H7Y32_03030 [Chloroflexales bacterium]|nr:hypothetical protein [Chloroflexales bacterium]
MMNTASYPRSRLTIALTVLLAMQFVGVGVLLPAYAFNQPSSAAFRIFAVAMALGGVATLWGVWQQRSWAPWAVLTLLSFKLTVDLFNYALNLDRLLLPLSELINGAILVLAFRWPTPASTSITRGQRVFFAFVLLLAGWVGVWGMFFPVQAVTIAIPLTVPPLHARFLGAMYLSGATFMAFALAARSWGALRVVVPMIAIWTGMLGVVSLFYLDVFSWDWRRTWVWFVAYIAFPIIATWICWVQRRVAQPAAPPTLPVVVRAYWFIQGALVTLLALALLAVPAAMVAIWPWNITPLLAQIYSAPFLSYGLGSLYAARQRQWSEVRIPTYAMLVFTLGVLLASSQHLALFDFRSLSAWVWFGGFGIAALALASFGFVSATRAAPAARAQQRYQTPV